MNNLCSCIFAAALLVFVGLACSGGGEKALPTNPLPVVTPFESIPLLTPTTAPASRGLTQHSSLDAGDGSGEDNGGHPEGESKVDEESRPPRQWIVRASREEDSWRSTWQKGLVSLQERLEELYLDDFHVVNAKGGKYVVVVFRDGLPDDADALLNDFSDDYNVHVKVEYLNGYSQKDLEQAIKRVEYSVYCDQYTVNAETYADDTGYGAVIRADVLISADS